MDLEVRREDSLDFQELAALATVGFEGASTFDAARLEWLYRRAFSQPTITLALMADGRKVGHLALLGQSLQVEGREERAAAMVDVFILPAFRSMEAISTLYAAAERVCRELGFRTLLAVPNAMAVNVNRRFFKLEKTITLEIRAGAALPVRPLGLRQSRAVARLDRAEALRLFADYLPGPGSGLCWTPERLWERLQDPKTRYGVHAIEDLLLISSRSHRRGIPFTLVSALFERPGARVETRQMRKVLQAACAMHRSPPFVYVGRHEGLPLPGTPVPERYRPSLMIVQSRNFQNPGDRMPLDRFELLDFDFA